MKKKSFDILFRELYTPLYYYALQIVRDVEVSKDIASDAFEHIWMKRRDIEEATAKSYLYVYVRNKSIDHLRHMQTREQYRRFFTELTELSVQMEYKEQDERMQGIENAMSKLTPHTKHILEECYVQRKKYKEVAEEMNISVSAVRKHIVKALKLIREECVKIDI